MHTAHKLADVLGDLNATIDAWNKDLAEELELGDVTPEKAKSLHVPPDTLTADVALAEPKDWPANVLKAIAGKLIECHGHDILKLCRAVDNPTETIGGLKRGTMRGQSPHPMLFLATSIAHLLAVFEHQQEKKKQAKAAPVQDEVASGI